MQAVGPATSVGGGATNSWSYNPHTYIYTKTYVTKYLHYWVDPDTRVQRPVQWRLLAHDDSCLNGEDAVQERWTWDYADEPK